MREALCWSLNASVELSERLFKESEQLFIHSRVLREDSNRLRAAADALKVGRRSLVAAYRMRRT